MFSNLQLLQFEPKVYELDHGVLLSLRVLGQLQDQLLTLLDGQLQLFNVRCHKRSLEGRDTAEQVQTYNTQKSLVCAL